MRCWSGAGWLPPRARPPALWRRPVRDRVVSRMSEPARVLAARRHNAGTGRPTAHRRTPRRNTGWGDGDQRTAALSIWPVAESRSTPQRQSRRPTGRQGYSGPQRDSRATGTRGNAADRNRIRAARAGLTGRPRELLSRDGGAGAAARRRRGGRCGGCGSSGRGRSCTRRIRRAGWRRERGPWRGCGSRRRRGGWGGGGGWSGGRGGRWGRHRRQRGAGHLVGNDIAFAHADAVVRWARRQRLMVEVGRFEAGAGDVEAVADHRERIAGLGGVAARLAL